MNLNKILVLGATGRIGSELVVKLRKRYGNDDVIVGWHDNTPTELLSSGPSENVDVTDKVSLQSVFERHKVEEVYNLASVSSDLRERRPDIAWNVHIGGLVNVLELAKSKKTKIFWPSSNSVFESSEVASRAPQEIFIRGDHTLEDITLISYNVLANFYGNTPNAAYCHEFFWLDKKTAFNSNSSNDQISGLSIPPPVTFYGVVKIIGELVAAYYWNQGIDIRSLRYSPMISSKTPISRGFTGFIADMFSHARQENEFISSLHPDTVIHLTAMEDGIFATEKLMGLSYSEIKRFISYNLVGVIATLKELEEEIKKNYPTFRIAYNTNSKQKQLWPSIVDTSVASTDLGFIPRYDLKTITKSMLLI